jgi:hypothetical protein
MHPKNINTKEVIDSEPTFRELMAAARSGCEKYPMDPNNEFTAITNKLVPTLLAMSMPRIKLNTGTIINPPPTPTNPVSSPTPSEGSATRINIDEFARGSGRLELCVRRGLSIKKAASSIMRAKIRS